MREPASYTLGDLDLDLVRRFDEVCRPFEADWRDTGQRHVEEYLGSRAPACPPPDSWLIWERSS
jgi:hypothetical protein